MKLSAFVLSAALVEGQTNSLGRFSSSVKTANTTIWVEDPGEPCGKIPTPEYGIVDQKCKKKQGFHGDECEITCFGGTSKYTCSCTEKQSGSKLVIAKDSCDWILDEESYSNNCDGWTTTTTTTSTTTTTTTTTTSTTTTTTTTTTTVRTDICEPLTDPNGKWKCTDDFFGGSQCKLKCQKGHKPVNGRKRKCKCKHYKGGNPKNRPWKAVSCQWSAKRQRFFDQKYPGCQKVETNAQKSIGMIYDDDSYDYEMTHVNGTDNQIEIEGNNVHTFVLHDESSNMTHHDSVTVNSISVNYDESVEVRRVGDILIAI